MPLRPPRPVAAAQFVGGNRLTLLRNGVEAFPAMFAAVEGAKTQILLEMYWFDSDRVGRRFAMALTEAAKRGVEVAVIYDAVGSSDADPEMFDGLREVGVHVFEYNPVLPWRQRFKLDRLSRRDHRKLLIVDGVLGFTGGLNIADPWLPKEEGGDGFRDDVVCVEGGAVAGMTDVFFTTWDRHKLPKLRRVASAAAAGSATQGGSVRVIGEAFHRNRRETVQAYLLQLRRAKHRAFLANSYFVPDRSILRALTGAARRGVDVRVLVPGQSDVPVVRLASRNLFARLLKRGVRLFELQGNVLHSKTAVVDGHWSTVGTFNLDHLSLRYNLEVNLEVMDRRFGAVMEQSFYSDLDASEEVTLESLERQPIWQRVAQSALYRFRKLM